MSEARHEFAWKAARAAGVAHAAGVRMYGFAPGSTTPPEERNRRARAACLRGARTAYRRALAEYDEYFCGVPLPVTPASADTSTTDALAVRNNVDPDALKHDDAEDDRH